MSRERKRFDNEWMHAWINNEGIPDRKHLLDRALPLDTPPRLQPFRQIDDGVQKPGIRRGVEVFKYSSTFTVQYNSTSNIYYYTIIVAKTRGGEKKAKEEISKYKIKLRLKKIEKKMREREDPPPLETNNTISYESSTL